MATKFKNILITGASSGIGAALAKHYASLGATNIFICGRNEQRLQDTALACEKAGANVYSRIIDVTDAPTLQNWIAEADRIANLNLVLANAGVATLEETTNNVYNTFNINVLGVLNTVLPTIEIYKNRHNKQPKAIGLLSSIAGYHGLPTCPSYSASKACIKAYGSALRVALRQHKIQVSTICPGFVKSSITDQNTCPMPFFMSAEKAAQIIATRLEHNVGLIAFPWQMRLAAWGISILPEWLSSFIYSRLPHKV